jgi:hypothetical protein
VLTASVKTGVDPCVGSVGLPARAVRAQLQILPNVRLRRLLLLLLDPRHVLVRGMHGALDAVIVHRVVDDAIGHRPGRSNLCLVGCQRGVAADWDVVFPEPGGLGVKLVLPVHGGGGGA